MKKPSTIHTIRHLIILFVFSILLILSYSPAFAQAPPGGTVSNPGYNLISPLGNSAPVTDPTNYIGNLFTIFISVSVILAVIRLMICGIQYITSEAISSKAAAKTCITYVIGGLLLVLTSFIILSTIDDDLVGTTFNDISASGTGGGGGTPIPGGGGGGTPPGGGGGGGTPPGGGGGGGTTPPVNQPPVADFTPNNSCSSLSCSFTSISTDDVGISTHQWVIDGNALGSGNAQSYTFPGPGVYTVQLTVTDTNNVSSVESKAITVNDPSSGPGPGPANNPPQASFDADCSSGLTCTFDDDSVDTDGSIVSTSWNFGDGNTGTGDPTNHTFGAPGTYLVTITVTDNSGDSSSISANVTVVTSNTTGPFSYQVEEVGSRTWVGNPTLTLPGTGRVITSPNFATFNACQTALEAAIATPRFTQTYPVPFGNTNRCAATFFGGLSYTYTLSEVLQFGLRYYTPSPPFTDISFCSSDLFSKLLQKRYELVSGCN